MENPLLDTSSLPRFDEIQPDHVLPAIRKVIADNRAALDRLLDTSRAPDIDALVAPIEHMDHELDRVWSPVCHLQSVLGSPDWREAYKQALPLLTEYGTEVSQNVELQRAYAAVQKTLPPDASEESRSAVEQALRNFHLAGVDLEDAAKERFKEIMQELAELQATFEHNVVDASDAWSLHITGEETVRGLPAALLQRAAEPFTQRHTKAHFISIENFVRKNRRKGLL
jgi:oligopeptidase A